MSNRIKFNNMLMLQNLAQLDRAGKNLEACEDQHDFTEFERTKNEVNKELIKLQQKMKQVVTTKEERYIELRFFEWTKVVLVEETNMYLKLDLLGAESPVTFTCEIVDNTKADLHMYLSTQTAEPDDMNNQKAVQRMRVFKFTAKKKAPFFADDGVCYIMMHSQLGCTLKITAASNKIRALAEPEKVKEFNKVATKAEMAAEENAQKKKEVHVQILEEKYDGKLKNQTHTLLFVSKEILRKYLVNEKPRKNLKRENAENVGFYKTKKDLEQEMNKHRRDVLKQVATIYK